MAAERSILPFVRDEFPSLYRTEGSRLLDFISSYYEYLEGTDSMMGPLELIENFLDENNVDLSSDTFLEQIREELTPGVPMGAAGDERFITKRVLDLFDHMGDVNGLITLFRVLYDRNIAVRKPGDQILMPSAGNWVRRDTISIFGNVSDPFSVTVNEATVVVPIKGMRVQGRTNRDIAEVQDVIYENRFGVPVTVLLVTNVRGEFRDNDPVATVRGGYPIGTVYGSVGPIAGVAIDIAGTGHEVDDEVNFLATAGRGGTGIIREVSDVSSITFALTAMGDGYRHVPENEAAGDYSSTITVGGLGDPDHPDTAKFIVTSVGSDWDLTVVDEQIGNSALTVLNTGPVFGNTGAAPGFLPAMGGMANRANVSSRMIDSFSFTTETVGSVRSIRTISNGRNYRSLPAATAVDTYISRLNLRQANTVGTLGASARVTPSYVPGAIQNVDVLRGGRNYAQDEIVTIRNVTDATAEDGTGFADITGFGRDVGNYVDRRGWPSADDRIHDGTYYQIRSYVVCTDTDETSYRETVEGIFNPVGSTMFTEVDIVNEVDVGDTTVTGNADEFFDDVGSPDDDYKLIVSGTSSNVDATTLWRQAVIGKNITRVNVSHVVPRHAWTPDVTYPAYPTNGYVINDTNEVFKCLANNGPSTIQPRVPTSTGIWVPVRTTDGYIWQYMYRVDTLNRFSVIRDDDDDWMPVQTLDDANESDQWVIQQNAVDGSITYVVVTDGGDGYLQTSGNIQPQFDTSIITLSEGSRGTADAAYGNYTFFINQGIGVNESRRIVGYDSDRNTVTLNSPLRSVPDRNTTYIISPTLEITGTDSMGDPVANTATGRVEVAANGSVTAVTINSGVAGSDYATASASVVGDTGTGAVLAVHLPPAGGHGSDAVSELGRDDVMVSVDTFGTEEGVIDASNDFRTFAIIEEPEYRDGVSPMVGAFDLTYRLNITADSPMENAWLKDGDVRGTTSSTQATIVSFSNTNFDHTRGVLRVNAINGSGFAVGENANTSFNGITATITDVTEPDIIPDTGTIRIIRNVSTITRNPLQNERFKTIVGF